MDDIKDEQWPQPEKLKETVLAPGGIKHPGEV